MNCQPRINQYSYNTNADATDNSLNSALTKKMSE